jgi:cysteine synthase
MVDMTLVDEVVSVTDEEAFEMAPRLAKEEGIIAGISCGAAMAAALKVAARPERKGKTLVVILPDQANATCRHRCSITPKRNRARIGTVPWQEATS